MTPIDLIESIEKRGSEIDLSPRILAEMAKIDPATWWRIKTGKNKPQFDTWERLQRLHVDVSARKAKAAKARK